MPASKKPYPMVPLPVEEMESGAGDTEEELTIEGQELPEPIPPMEVEPEPEPARMPSRKDGGFEWVGSERRDEAAEGDGISDLFRVTDEDVGAGADVDDLVEVDMEKDVIDAGPDGTLDDLTDVTVADIMGDEEFGQPLTRQPKRRLSRTRAPSGGRFAPAPPPGLRGLRGV